MGRGIEYLYYNDVKYIVYDVEIDFYGMVHNVAEHVIFISVDGNDISNFLVGNHIGSVQFYNCDSKWFDLYGCFINSITHEDSLDESKEIYTVKIIFTSYKENIALVRKNKLNLL